MTGLGKKPIAKCHLLFFFFFCASLCRVSAPLWIGFTRVSTNSPSRCPIISSTTCTGIQARPLCTLICLPTQSGRIIDRLVPRTEPSGSVCSASAKGPFHSARPSVTRDARITIEISDTDTFPARFSRKRSRSTLFKPSKHPSRWILTQTGISAHPILA